MVTATSPLRRACPRATRINSPCALCKAPMVGTSTRRFARGFARTYPAGGVGDRWLMWTFPTQFRSPSTKVEDERQASYLDTLTSELVTSPAKLLPEGDYQVKVFGVDASGQED